MPCSPVALPLDLKWFTTTVNFSPPRSGEPSTRLAWKVCAIGTRLPFCAGGPQKASYWARLARSGTAAGPTGVSLLRL